jgi:hypothetical protein
MSHSTIDVASFSGTSVVSEWARETSYLQVRLKNKSIRQVMANRKESRLLLSGDCWGLKKLCCVLRLDPHFLPMLCNARDSSTTQ